MSVYLKKAKQQTKLREVITNRTPATATRPTPPRPNARWHTAHGRKGDYIFVEFGRGIGLTWYVLGFGIIITMATIGDVSFFEHLFVDCFNLAFAGSWKWTKKYWRKTKIKLYFVISSQKKKTRVCKNGNFRTTYCYFFLNILLVYPSFATLLKLVYHGISYESLLFSPYIHEPLGECVHQENASGKWNIPWYSTR